MRDEDLRRLLARHIDDEKKVPGLVAGVIQGGDCRIVAHGAAGTAAAPVTPDGDTVFEIGSVTKVFTGLLLAEMASRGEVAFDTPVSALLPGCAPFPARGRPITLLDLAMHVSGLPRLPDNLDPPDPQNPYAAYNAEKL